MVEQSSQAGKVAKVSKVATCVILIAEVGYSIYDNCQQGSSVKKTIIDAVVDLGISGGSMWISGSIGMAIGGAVGSFCPGLGNVVGGVAGFAIGVGLYWVTDQLLIDDKTLRDSAKDYCNSLF